MRRTIAEPQDILDFWFGVPGSPGYGAFRDVWFQRDAAFDAEIDRRFRTDYEDAAARRREAWRDVPEPCLAYVILLDQFPRNLFRGDPRAWATDDMALAAARGAVAAGFDGVLPRHARKFLYMPYMHSESVANQHASVALFEALGEEPSLVAARRHLEIIERFGRFPHRNAVLGRESTAAEREFLKEPNSSF